MELIYRNESMRIQMLYFLLNMMIKIFPIVGLLLLIPMIAIQKVGVMIEEIWTDLEVIIVIRNQIQHLRDLIQMNVY